MKGYFDYLCKEAGIGGPQGRPYRHRAESLMDAPFAYSIPGDKNRESDGLELRIGYSDAPKNECSVLEVMVAMCQKLCYMADGMLPREENLPGEWFYEMIRNLGIVSLTDDIWERNPEDAAEICWEQVGGWIKRRYDYDGTGGIFPLDHPNDDQTKVELWYQLNAYLMEKIGNIT